MTPPTFNPPLPAEPSAGGLQLSSSQMDFGPVEHNGAKPREQRVSVTSTGRAQVAGSERWIVPTPGTLTGSGTVAVSIEPTQLKLATVIWRAPDLIRPVAALVRRNGSQVWWVALLVLLIAAGTSGGQQAIVLIVGGWLGLHLAFWLTARVLGRLGFRSAERRGQLTVTAGSDQATLDVRVKVIPSRREMIVGWGGVVLAVGALGMAISGGLLWLVLKL
jgi:hypothetical protein